MKYVPSVQKSSMLRWSHPWYTDANLGWRTALKLWCTLSCRKRIANFKEAVFISSRNSRSTLRAINHPSYVWREAPSPVYQAAICQELCWRPPDGELSATEGGSKRQLLHPFFNLYLMMNPKLDTHPMYGLCENIPNSWWIAFTWLRFSSHQLRIKTMQNFPWIQIIVLRNKIPCLEAKENHSHCQYSFIGEEFSLHTLMEALQVSFQWDPFKRSVVPPLSLTPGVSIIDFWIMVGLHLW